MHTHISQQEDFTSVCSSASFSFGCIGSAMWIFKNKVWLWTSKLKVMMENVLSEQRAILSWEEWAPVAQIKTCSWSKHQAWNLSWKRLSNFPSSSSLSVSCGDTHLTARKFLQCKSLPGLPVSAGLLLFASPLHSNTHALHAHTHTHTGFLSVSALWHSPCEGGRGVVRCCWLLQPGRGIARWTTDLSWRAGSPELAGVTERTVHCFQHKLLAT